MRFTLCTSVVIGALCLSACGDKNKTTDGGTPAKDKTPAPGKDTSTPAKDAATPAKDSGATSKDGSATTPAVVAIPKGQEGAVTVQRIFTLRNAVMEHDIEAGAEPSGKSGDAKISGIEQVLIELRKVPQCKAILDKLDKGAIADTDKDGHDEVIDGWGKPMIYSAKVGHGDDNKADDVLPESNGPVIASGGPDGSFGDAKAKADDAALGDNIYSNDLDAAKKKYDVK